jgi:hypothetical protein
MSGIAPLENYLHFVLARQEHDHTDRLKEIRCRLWFWSATTKNTAPRIKLTGTRPMSLPARFPMQDSSYYRAKDTITLRQTRLSHIKRSGTSSRIELLISFNHHRDGFPSADAERGDAPSLAEIVHGVNQGSQYSSSTCANGVSESNGAAPDVYSFRIQT